MQSNANPTPKPASQPGQPAPHAASGNPGSRSPAMPQDGTLDADAAEPVPHEHLPRRSDDN